MLSEQRWKLHALPTGIGGQVANALCRESGSIVLDGVTSVQGGRESRIQGEGTEKFRARRKPIRVAIGYR